MSPKKVEKLICTARESGSFARRANIYFFIIFFLLICFLPLKKRGTDHSLDESDIPAPGHKVNILHDNRTEVADYLLRNLLDRRVTFDSSCDRSTRNVHVKFLSR